jgi:hypothetical protein
VEAGTWGKENRTYGHILPVVHRGLNIVEPIREDFWRKHDPRRWKLHQYFHHLSSSQALAFNLFFSMHPRLPLSLRHTRRVLGIKSESVDVDFEVVFPGGDGTNIDVLMTESRGARAVIEIKYTESAFGRARNDEDHVRKLRDTYVPRLLGRLPAQLLEPAPFLRDYQLFRNLAQIRPDSDDRVILMLPREHSRMWDFANSWCDRTDLGDFCGRIRTVAVEDVIAAMRADATALGDCRAIDAVAEKYLG